ncbi:MAG: 4Fe-4S binding protein [Candidatus Hydrogenedentes bacterium]|nr:4Fe-4S binding protein [Candidatus Hydrogenedentota bacterium]
MAVRVDANKCIGCGVCMTVCAAKAISMGARIVVIDPARCTECGSCVDECLRGALGFAEKAAEMDGAGTGSRM